MDLGDEKGGTVTKMQKLIIFMSHFLRSQEAEKGAPTPSAALFPPGSATEGNVRLEFAKMKIMVTILMERLQRLRRQCFHTEIGEYEGDKKATRINRMRCHQKRAPCKADRREWDRRGLLRFAKILVHKWQLTVLHKSIIPY